MSEDERPLSASRDPQEQTPTDIRRNGMRLLAIGVATTFVLVALAIAFPDLIASRHSLKAVALTFLVTYGTALRGLYFAVWGQQLPHDPSHGHSTIPGSWTRIGLGVVLFVITVTVCGWAWLRFVV